MKKSEGQEPFPKETHFVKATLSANGTVFNDVPCKIYLPERTNEKPFIIFKPSEAVALILSRSHKASLKAVIYDSASEAQTTIEAPEVYLKEGSTTFWGSDISDSTIQCDPQDLHIIHHIRDEEQKKTHLVFWISPNTFLTPTLIYSPSSKSGEIKYEKVGNSEVTLKNDLKLEFEKHFRLKTAKNKDLIQWAYLVACAELDVSADDVVLLKNTMQDIDDFLLIASFAARSRTACLGWTATDHKSIATFFRGNYTFPDGKEDDIHNGVVGIQSFKQFMETCYSSFLSYENKLALRNAIYSILPFDPTTIETTFLQTFAGLETLILDFRRQKNLEYILPETEWADLSKYLQRCIKKSTKPKIERSERAMIYSVLCELNRVSLRHVFDEFCRHYAIDLSDLWQVFGDRNKGIVGLSDIRNRLIHGDPFPNDLYGALVAAKNHLKYTLERVIVRVLGWDVGQTMIDGQCLKMYDGHIKGLPLERARLSEYILKSAVIE